MSAPELFDPSSGAKASPRLDWLTRHNLSLGQLPDGTRFCLGRDGVGYGTTHKDSELEYCKAADVTHWEVEQFIKAGVVLPTEVTEEEWG